MKKINQLLFVLSVLSVLPAQGQPQPSSQVSNPPSLQSETNAPTGVMGFSVLFNGKVWRVFPGSDLNRYGIHRGDRVLGYMGHKFHSMRQMVEDIVGPVGTPCEFTFLHDGQTITIYPKRVDASLFLKHEPLFNKHYHKVIAKSKTPIE